MRFFLAGFAAILFLAVIGQPVDASAKKHVGSHTSISAPQYNPKFAAFLVDGDTGKILYQENADKLRHPASLTKMMTIYLLFEALENKKLRFDTKLTVSAYAAGMAKTNLNLRPGETISVRDAILAVIVKSANDVAVVIGESLGGTEQNFAKIMNQRARQLGMKNTFFKNASGLHDPQQVTTAKDMALLGIALKKHYPEYFPFFSRTEFTFDGVNYTGHNHVMENYPGADGLKTGFVNASGFNLVTTATRRGISLVGVVMGGRTHQSRDSQMVKLLDSGFAKDASLKSKSYIAQSTAKPVANDNLAPKQAATATSSPQNSKIEGDEESAEDSADDDSESADDAPQKPAAPQTTQAKIETDETNTYVRGGIAAAAPTNTQGFMPAPKQKPAR